MRYTFLILALMPTVVEGSANSVGPNGIDVPDGLDGMGVLIGQAEGSRSGKAGYDAAARSAPNTAPAGVYHQMNGGMDPAYPNLGNHLFDEHATLVAGVMIDTSVFASGVSPMAQLHSIGLGSATTDPDAALVLNRVASSIGGGAVAAINLSFGIEVQFLEEDGKSHLTEFVDWSARQHNVLYVVSWINANQNPHEFFKPQDNFNGITVAASAPDDNLRYHRVSSSNIEDSDLNDQYSIDILAPGDSVLMQGWEGAPGFQDGSSIAAPHVTGAVAILQQYAQQQIDDGKPGFGTNAKRHDVMKAVLINSADKLAGVHGSNRTICDTPGPGACNDWTDSAAFNNSFTPLDDKMGAGHLNVRRAVQQLAPGEYGPGMVPLIGWDRGVIGPFERNEYIFSENAGGYIAITLAWDRIINKTGGNSYNAGDQFFPYADVDDVLSNLDVSLVGPDGLTVYARSQSSEMNLEHIFFDIEASGQYRIVVEHVGGLQALANYALAWWNGDAPPLELAGDFNGDGSVDAADYVVWRKNDGSPQGYDEWRANFGNSSGSGSVLNASVPEPSGFMLSFVLLFAFGALSRLPSRASRPS